MSNQSRRPVLLSVAVGVLAVVLIAGVGTAVYVSVSASNAATAANEALAAEIRRGNDAEVQRKAEEEQREQQREEQARRQEQEKEKSDARIRARSEESARNAARFHRGDWQKLTESQKVRACALEAELRVWTSDEKALMESVYRTLDPAFSDFASRDWNSYALRELPYLVSEACKLDRSTD